MQQPQTQTQKSNRSYSDFFTSGFRAMASRAARRTRMPHTSSTPPSTAPSTAPSINLDTDMTTTHSISIVSNNSNSNSNGSAPSTTSSTRRRTSASFRRITNRHSRTTSMIAPSAHAYAYAHTPTHADPPARDRRSSIASFSSWLFDRKGSAAAATIDNSFTFSPSPQKNARELHGSTEITEVWITAGGPYTPSNISISRDTDDEPSLFGTIDPFASSPESKSFFIDLSEPHSHSPTPPPPPAPARPTTPTPKRESFLSFTPSPDRSFLHLPAPRARRERPTSVQTMPLPSRAGSRRSSCYRPPSRGKSDHALAWTLPEERTPTALGPGPARARRESLAADADWADPTHDIDWRQFHIELLGEDV